eukprot:9387061-Alexandrium_andersonii.AAC.1
MSASLVGSEMCIRDSGKGDLRLRRTAQAGLRPGVRGHHGHDALDLQDCPGQDWPPRAWGARLLDLRGVGEDESCLLRPGC